MKVKIGPYTPWWTSRIFYRYMNKKYNYEWEKATTPFEKFLDKLEDALSWFYHYTFNKYFSLQRRRIEVKIDDYDVWSLNNTLAHIILPGLILLKERKQGAPFVDDEDVPEYLRSTAAGPKENEWDTDENHYKRWEWVLDEMIYAFQCETDEYWDDQFYSGESDISFVETIINGKTYKEIVYGPNNTFKVDREGMAAAWKRRNNAMRLFGKYYDGLWS